MLCFKLARFYTGDSIYRIGCGYILNDDRIGKNTQNFGETFDYMHNLVLKSHLFTYHCSPRNHSISILKEKKLKSTAKILLEKLINKAFPEFSNKVTWLLIYVGTAILLMPAPTYIMLLNLIIDFYNNKTNSHVKIIDIGDFTPSTGAAITLIISGLTYHLIIKGLQIYSELHNERIKIARNKNTITNQKEINDRKINADLKLYESFKSILPPNSSSIAFLKEQDFGFPFHKPLLDDIEKFTYQWGRPDQHFHDSEIQSKSKEFYDKADAFIKLLASAAGYIRATPLLSIPTDDERAHDWDWSDGTINNVKKANELSGELHTIYCELVVLCKKKLLI